MIPTGAFLAGLFGIACVVGCIYLIAIDVRQSAERRMARRAARLTRRRALCRSRARLRLILADGLPCGVVGPATVAR